MHTLLVLSTLLLLVAGCFLLFTKPREISARVSTILPSAEPCLAPRGSGAWCLEHPAFCPGRVFHPRATLGPGGQRAAPRRIDWRRPGRTGALPGTSAARVGNRRERHVRGFSPVTSLAHALARRLGVRPPHVRLCPS